MHHERPEFLRLWREKKPVLSPRQSVPKRGRVLERLEAVMERCEGDDGTYSVIRRMRVRRSVRKGDHWVKSTVQVRPEDIATFVDPIERTLQAIVACMNEILAPVKEVKHDGTNHEGR